MFVPWRGHFKLSWICKTAAALEMDAVCTRSAANDFFDRHAARSRIIAENRLVERRGNGFERGDTRLQLPAQITGQFWIHFFQQRDESGSFENFAVHLQVTTKTDV